MAKKLLIVRHAKAEWISITNKDFDRPLHPVGEQEALLMAKRLLKKEIKPDYIISSPALRAITTCKLIAKKLNLEHLINLEPRIYEAPYNTILNVINNLDNNHDFVALFGHNNGITDLAIYLSNADLYDISTCGMVLIEFPFDDWSLISQNTGDMLFYDFPEKYAN